MAIDVSELNDIIEERLGPIIQIVEEESLLRVLDGEIEEHEGPCPGVYRATYYVPDVTITDCCEGYEGAGSAYHKDFEMVCYQSGDNYCEKDLAKLYRKAGRKVKYTAGREDAGAAGELVARANLADFLKKFNKMLVLGQIANGDRIDGWITQALAEGAQTPTITASSLWGAYIQMLFALPEDYVIYGERLVMLVPYKFRKYYQLFFAFNRLWFGDNSVLNDVYGTDGIEIVYTRTLDDTNQVLLTPARNLVAIVSDKDDEYVYEWDYIKNWKDGNRYIWYVKGCIGVGLYDAQFAVVATIPNNIVSNTNLALDVNLINQPIEVTTTTAPAAPLSAPSVSSTAESIAMWFEDQGLKVPAAVSKMLTSEQTTTEELAEYEQEIEEPNVEPNTEE